MRAIPLEPHGPVRVLLHALGVAACFTATLAAQKTARSDPKTVADVLARLGSQKLEDMAWGGYLAGEHGVTAAAGAIREALVRVRQGRGVERPWNPAEELAALALLDGLIRLDTPVPPHELEPFLQNFALAPALVLLSRQPRRNAGVLLRFFRGNDKSHAFRRYAWIAAGNLLARTHTPGFAAALLDELDCELRITVLSHRGSTRRFPGSCHTSMCGGPRIPTAFPPIPLYILTSGDLAEQVAPGRSPLCFHRFVQRHKDPWRCRGTSTPTPNDLRASWLGGGFEWSRQRTVAWSSATEYLNEVAVARGEVERDFGKLVGQLRQRGLLTSDESEGRKPDIALEVTDRRRSEDRTSRLPALPAAWRAKVRRR